MANTVIFKIGEEVIATGIFIPGETKPPRIRKEEEAISTDIFFPPETEEPSEREKGFTTVKNLKINNDEKELLDKCSTVILQGHEFKYVRITQKASNSVYWVLEFERLKFFE
jgi:hypothetical protein